MINGKYLSYILRHAPSAANVELDCNGYANIDELIDGIRQTGRNTDFAELENIVANDAKRRFSFNEDRTKIRANYGHSVAVNLQMEAIAPPIFLYHGTAKKYLDGIASEGITKRSRNFVHLSSEPHTAFSVGSRHGQAVVLKIFAEKMYRDGYAFYLVENNVWLTEFVPCKYIDFNTAMPSNGCEIVPFEMARLTSKRTGIQGNIWVCDATKSVAQCQYRVIYENAGAKVSVYFGADRPEAEGDCGASVMCDLSKVFEWIKYNKKSLIKLYDKVNNYDIVDFLNEMQPLNK